MSAFFLLIGISLIVAVGFLIAFLWAVKTNQYEDDYTPSVRMLFNDNTPDTNDIEQNNSARKDAKAQSENENKTLCASVPLR